MDAVFVCNVNALSDAQRKRYKEIIQKLDEARQSIKVLSNGYAFGFKAESQLIQDAIEEGDTVAADARVIQSTALQKAEAALTGESLPVSKDASLSGGRT